MNKQSILNRMLRSAANYLGVMNCRSMIRTINVIEPIRCVEEAMSDIIRET